ncbi:MAG TPA: hypothetical protein VL551_29000 [Actinospica sp.]|nr:hypothetical protein [Actinospica sp.]
MVGVWDGNGGGGAVSGGAGPGGGDGAPGGHGAGGGSARAATGPTWAFTARAAEPGPGGAGAVGPVTGNPRLPKGGLQALVLDLLAEYYPDELGPVGMSKLLGGRSIGAITNAAERLCREHRLVCTRLAPKRYAALHSGVQAAEAATGTGHAD